MYLVDTNVISEARKGAHTNKGVSAFFNQTKEQRQTMFLSVITIGELRRGVELIRSRADLAQAQMLEAWLSEVFDNYGQFILDIDYDVAQVWGRLRVPNHENALDKLIAATALVHDLTVVTRNQNHFATTGARVLNPFV
jgi:predicted nucleic acid-binding protein